ncbi:MAG TPA: rhomboid family intramembrane serine protease [Thermotogota bacterium]|nr:rhomboid family intramembrane serine protease [Thermotogota bacterium]
MRKNPLTKGILIINIFMFAMSAVFSGGSFLKSLWSGGDLQTLLKSGASFGAYVQQGQVYRLVSSLFLHAGLIHLIFNSYALYMFGTIVESIFGSRRFIVVYLASGFVGALLTQLFYPGVVSVGASGAIFGLIGQLFSLGLRKDTPRRLTPVTGTALLPMIIINLLLGFTVPGINNMAHIGGFATGFLFGLFLAPFRIAARHWSILWTVLSVLCVVVSLVCISYVFLFPEPDIEQIINFANQYAEVLTLLSGTQNLRSDSYYLELLRPFDGATRALKEDVQRYIETGGRSDTLYNLQLRFKAWQAIILKKYGTWIKKAP